MTEDEIRQLVAESDDWVPAADWRGLFHRRAKRETADEIVKLACDPDLDAEELR